MSLYHRIHPYAEGKELDKLSKEELIDEILSMYNRFDFLHKCISSYDFRLRKSNEILSKLKYDPVVVPDDLIIDRGYKPMIPSIKFKLPYYSNDIKDSDIILLEKYFYSLLSNIFNVLYVDSYTEVFGSHGYELLVFEYSLDLKQCVHKSDLKNEQTLSSVGRKNKFSDDDIQKIKDSKESYRAIAKEFNCSVGLVSKIKNS